jgi:transcriptional accessory protein Tex/SPT6
MLRGFRRFCTSLPDVAISSTTSMSKSTKDPAFRLLLDDCKAINRSRQDISHAFALLADEQTVPFIARYRREQTGDLPVETLYELQRRWSDFVATLKLRDSRLKTLEAAGKCTAEVRAQFAGCVSREELDELYAGLKETKTAKSAVVAAFGLEEAAQQLLSGEVRHVVVSQQAASAAAADKYSALDALVYLCAASIAGDADVLALAREQTARFAGNLTTTLTAPYKALLKEREEKKQGKEGKGGKGGKVEEKGAKLSELDRFRDYHALQRRIPALAAHQVSRSQIAPCLLCTLYSQK